MKAGKYREDDGGDDGSRKRRCVPVQLKVQLAIGKFVNPWEKLHLCWRR